MMRILMSMLVAAGFMTATPLAGQTPEQWAEWGGRVHGGFGSMIAWGILVGLDASETLDAERRQLAVEFIDSPDAPCACVADGIAIAVSASVGQRTLSVVQEPLPPEMIGRVKFTHRTTGRSVSYDLPTAAMVEMDRVNREHRGADRFNAVAALDPGLLYRRIE